ncbi:tyrosine-type recombinase/integrase [Candidatus Uhrbacteria bacterium]|nr:tyrosine-type recombinase/integrase [Candidatus Uhrbacteria bacterium]
MLMSDAIKEFSEWRKFKVKKNTVKGYEFSLKHLCVFLRNPDIESILLQDVMEHLNLMRDIGWEENSFVGRCMSFRKFFEFWQLRGLSVIDPELIPIPRKEYKIPRVVDDESFKKLLAAIPSKTNDGRHLRNRAIVMMLWDSGARNGEIMSLDVNDLDLERMRAIIRTEKSRGRRPIREIFWTRDTNDALVRWIEKRKRLAGQLILKEPDALFISICGGPHDTSGGRFTIKGVGEMLRRYCNRAGIPYINAHAFRHHMGHDVIKRGGSAADVMNILGHSSLASSTIYTMMTDIELEARYRQIKSPFKRRVRHIGREVLYRNI